MTQPPIPVALGHLPVQAGLAVPVVALRRGDRYAISVNHVSKALHCIRRGLCGICGKGLDQARAVVLTAQEGVDAHHATDPANHPECAAYAIAACPMLNGRMAHYRRDQGDVLHGPCDTPGCDCGSYVKNPLSPQHDGEPAPETWFAVWIRLPYRPAVNVDGELVGLAWDEPIRVREIKRQPAAAATVGGDQ